MANIEDYLIWRGDITFDVDPFNEIDNIILCELCYTDFDGIVSGPENREELISIFDACEKFFEHHTDEEIMSQEASTKVAPFLMRQLIKTKRFKDLKLGAYINEIDPESQSQFSAITFYPGDDSVFCAFRGTDNTIVGWREDFNMSFLNHTQGQQKAAEYLSWNFADCDKLLRVGGHSKGGNFAIYGSAFCDKKVSDKISIIYANDAPGFSEEILSMKEWEPIMPKIKRVIPAESIVGLLFKHDATDRIIQSSNSGLMQHDIMSWEVLCNHLVECDSMSQKSLAISGTLKDWIKQLDYNTREEFFDIVFESLFATGADTLQELNSNKKKNMKELRRMYSELDKDTKKMVNGVISALAASGSDHFINNMKSKYEELIGKN